MPGQLQQKAVVHQLHAAPAGAVERPAHLFQQPAVRQAVRQLGPAVIKQRRQLGQLLPLFFASQPRGTGENLHQLFGGAFAELDTSRSAQGFAVGLGDRPRLSFRQRQSPFRLAADCQQTVDFTLGVSRRQTPFQLHGCSFRSEKSSCSSASH